MPKSTTTGKAKRIRDALGLEDCMDVEFCRRELLDDHPFAWLVQVDGMIVDARWLPAELHAEARRRGLLRNTRVGVDDRPVNLCASRGVRTRILEDDPRSGDLRVGQSVHLAMQLLTCRHA